MICKVVLPANAIPIRRRSEVLVEGGREWACWCDAADAEHRAIAAALAAHGGNLSRTIERNTLRRKLAALGLRPAR